MEKQKHSLPRITAVLPKLEKTSEYIGSRTSNDRFHALGHAAGVCADRTEREKPKDPTEILNRMSMRIMSTLPGYILGSRGLDELRTDEEDGLSGRKGDKKTLIEAVIPFNHSLRALVDSFPEFAFEQVQNYCAQLTYEMSNPVDAAYCKRAVRETLVGMRNEIGMSQIIWNVEGVVDVLPAETIKEEMQGVDLTVIYHDKELKLDAKASDIGVATSLYKREAYMGRRGITERDNDSGYPVCSGIKYEDFEGGTRISEELAASLALRMKVVLDEIYRQKYGSAAA